jgi:hypothetical protein
MRAVRRERRIRQDNPRRVSAIATSDDRSIDQR